jgi:hypothetical protein
MPLCGSSRCGCALVSVPAASGAIDGFLPTIDVAGNGTPASPWNLTLNDDWVAAMVEDVAFVPTLTQSATVTKTVVRASYWRGGSGVEGSVRLSVTGAGTGANAVIVGLPLPVHGEYTANDNIGSGWIYDASTNFYYYGDVVVGLTTTTARFLIRNNGAAGTVLGLSSFTAALASTDVVQYQFSYQPA